MKGGFGTLEYSVSCSIVIHVLTQWLAGMATERPTRAASGRVCAVWLGRDDWLH